ncbi:MAG: cell division protein FtsB [Gammaproteobacteria bacterium SHHR-1]|uniref:cell division protein FtsB n=1 Tax=Magnetovirga frankeli TaxID=947516 RepID=UPI0012937AB5|nr:cell division protein FtsB [gamma proteobacterium SS-5]
MRWLILLLLLLLAGLQYRLWVGEGSLAEVAALHRGNEELRQELAQKQAANERQAADVIDLKQGSEAIEERARQELGMIREGEVFYQFAKPTAPRE